MKTFDEFQSAMAYWDKYYAEKYHWPGVYSLETMVSEMLVSYNAELYMECIREKESKLPFDCENCSIMMTGITRNVYSGIYGWSFFDACAFFYETVLPFFIYKMEELGFTGFGYIDSKVGADQEYDRYLTFVFSPVKESAKPAELAETLTSFLQEQYDTILLKGDRQVACFSALSRPVTDIKQLKTNFTEVLRLKQLSFFRMEPIVFTSEDHAAAYCPMDHIHLNEHCQQLAAAVYSGKEERFLALLDRLFLGTIKQSLDFFALDYVLNYCNYIFSNACTTYRLPLGKNLVRQNFFSIEQCCAAIRNEALRILAGIRGTGTSLSYLSREALCYIHAHYTEAISLKEIADCIGVVPSYLSRVFRQETGSSIVKYINALRIEKAKELLSRTDARVKEIAVDVGIPNDKYMLRLFREHTGISPQEYRAKYKS